MGEITFQEVEVVEPVPPRVGHTVTLDIGGVVYATCPGLTDVCMAYSRCMCRKARKHGMSDDPPDDFTAHGKHHICSEWDEGYMAETGACWVSEGLSLHPEWVANFIAEVNGIPGEYPVHACDQPSFVIDERSEYQYRRTEVDHA